MRNEHERILDMLEAIERVEKYAAQGRQAFEESDLIQTWIVHHLQILGEAAARLGSAFHEKHPEVPWVQVIAMRNILVHDYFSVDLEEVWQTVERDLPLLKRQLEALSG